MKALVLKEYKKLVYEEVEKPSINEKEVLIRIKASSICGSDVHGYDGRSGRRQPPIIMGHEAAGVIEEAGADAGDYKPGDRVTFNSTLYCQDCYFCRRGEQNMCEHGKVFGVFCDDYKLQGAMAEYAKVPAHILYRLPENVTFEQAALLEPLSIALHAIHRAPIRVNDTVIVIGTGTIGLLLTKLLKISSAGKIIAVDIDDMKLETARKNGADHIINSKETDPLKKILEITGGYGADICFEAVGVPPTTVLSIECLKRNGTVVLLGNVSPRIELPIQRAVLRELKLVGSYCCGMEYETNIDMLASGKINVDDVISVKAPLAEGAQWFDRLYNHSEGITKVVLLPWL